MIIITIDGANVFKIENKIHLLINSTLKNQIKNYT